MSHSRIDQDTPWKNILRDYFSEAIAFFFPQTARLIDWEKPIEFLETELQQIAVDAEVGRRYADLLVKVWRKRGQQMILLLHVEIQAKPEAIFSERMLVYNLRIFNLFRAPVISLAILCDNRSDWRPHRYDFVSPDTKLNFEFGIAKLLDYRERWDELEQSRNPFAIVVMAHLKIQETKKNLAKRKEWKFWLVRRLYELGYNRQDVLNLFKFIDWAMILPDVLKQSFWDQLRVYEEERRMPYITSVEQIGYARGLKESEHLITAAEQRGRAEERRSLVFRLLARRVGTLSPTLQSQIEALPLDRLEALSEALLDFENLADLESWLMS
jgi:Domain of unknown function (DUF4351)